MSSSSQAILKQMQYSPALVQERIKSASSSRPDFADSIMRLRGAKGELSEAEIEANASAIIISGSETLVDLLCSVTYWLLRTPDVLANVTTKLPLLTRYLNEALRLYPFAPGGLERDTVAQTTLSGYAIVPNAQVSLHQYAVYTSSSNFHIPEAFCLEHWDPDVPNNPASLFYNDNREVFSPSLPASETALART
ncbi:cytochrome P450 [Aspergillus spinulosporus]